MKRIIACVLAVMLLLGTSNPIYAAKKSAKETDSYGLKIEATSAVLMDAGTGTILYEKKPNKKMYPASITKIMTSLLTLENCQMDDVVTFSHEAVYGIEPGSSHIGIEEGEKLSVRNCLYGMLLESANEVSSALAEHVSGTIDNFAKLMTERAKELGCTKTNFVNANGLHSSEHYTTAHDMALITRAALRHTAFRDIASTRNYMVPKTKMNPARPLWNHHKMIKYPQSSIYGYEGMEGGKTGYTTMSGNTLVSFAKRGDMELICVILKSPGRSTYSDTKILFDYGFNNYTKIYPITDFSINPEHNTTPILKSYYTLVDPVDIPAYVDNDYALIINKKIPLSKIQKSISLKLDTANHILGTIQFQYKDQNIGSTNIYYKDIVVDPQQKKIHTQMPAAVLPIRLIAIVGAAAVAVLLLLFFLLLNIRRRRRSCRHKRHR